MNDNSAPPSGQALGAQVLVLDDDTELRQLFARALKKAGFVVYEARTLREALTVCRRHAPAVALVDHTLPDGTALQFLTETRDSAITTIVLTGYGTIDLAVDAIKAGAEQFLQKPVSLLALLEVVRKCVELNRSKRKETADTIRQGKPRRDPFLGASRAIQEVRELAEATRGADVPVLILGETGSGKGVLARWLHEHSPRSKEPFLDLNCSGLSKELVESDLFGHQRGAFTGANANKVGLLEVAHKGTIFLDEIGDLDATVQPKLLKVLEDRTFRRVGDTQVREVDVRIIAATHKDLVAMSRHGGFRNDLLFRINTVTFHLPSLNERREDIAALSGAVLDDLCEPRGLQAPALSKDAAEKLANHHWTGNMRELRNVLERALLFHRGGEVTAESLHLGPPSAAGPMPPASSSLKAAEEEVIRQALERAGGRVVEASRILGIPRSSLYAKMKRLRMDPGRSSSG